MSNDDHIAHWTEDDSHKLTEWDRKQQNRARFESGDDAAFNDVVADALADAERQIREARVAREAKDALDAKTLEELRDALKATGQCPPYAPRVAAGEPVEPEPEDDDEPITYPDVWDKHGGKIIVGVCGVLTVLLGSALWAIGAAIWSAVHGG